MTAASDKRADEEMRRLWKQFHEFYTGSFRPPAVGLSMADQHAFYEIAQPIMRSLAKVKAPQERDPTKAHARRDDPDTSKEAAANVTPVLRDLQETVFALFKHHGPMTDLQLSAFAPKGAAYSTYRTRRAELVDMGLLRHSGRKAFQDGHLRIIWEAVP